MDVWKNTIKITYVSMIISSKKLWPMSKASHYAMAFVSFNILNKNV
jgi:hypothetical protein